MLCSDSSESRKTDALEFMWLLPRKVVWLNVWYIEVESKYKEMRHATLTLETGGRESAKKAAGGWASCVITLRYCSTQDTQTRRYDQILVLTHLQEREEIDKQKLWSENDVLERTSACGSLGLENGGGHIVAQQQQQLRRETITSPFLWKETKTKTKICVDVRVDSCQSIQTIYTEKEHR